MKPLHAYLFVCFCGLSMQSCAVDSKRAHCVVVSDESHYVGEWLKSSQTIQDGVLQTEVCVALDAKLDGSDGNKKGKVRWATCLAGPDCDEAGVF